MKAPQIVAERGGEVNFAEMPSIFVKPAYVQHVNI